MEKTSYEECTESKIQNHRKSMEKLKADASGILTYTSQLKGLLKHFDSVEANIKKRSRELELNEKELQILSSDLEKKSQTFEAEKSEAGDLKKLVEECTEELRSKRNLLTVRLDSLTRVQRELESKDNQLGQVMAELKRRCNEAREVQERKREMEDETARNKKELSLIVEQIEDSGKQLATVDEQLEARQKQLATVDEQLEARQKLLEIRSLELVSTEKMLGSMRESIKLSNSDLELKENKIQSLNNLITDCINTIDSKSQELGENQKLIDQQTNELGVLQNQRDTIKQFIQILSEELVAKEQTRKEILETICRSSSEMEERAKEIKAAEMEASNLNVRSERVRQEVEGKEKELALLKNQIESEKNKVTQLKREMEEETYIKKRDLELVISKIEESGKHLATVNEQLTSQQRLLEIQSLELVSKETELGCVRESIKLSSSDLKLKEKMVESLNHRVSVCGKTIDSKSKELGEIQKLIEQQTNELGVMHRKKRDLALILNRIEESGKQLATIDRQLESRRKLLKIRSFKLLSANKKLGYVRKSIKLSSSDLKQKERMIHSLNNRVTVCGNTVDSKSKELGEIQKLIDQHTNELVVLRTQSDSIWQLIQGLSEELVAKEMELECVLESSKDFKFDIDVKEKRVQALNNLITISGEQLDMKSKELGEIQRELDLKKKQVRHMSNVFVKHEEQPAAAETAPFSEDALTHHEFPPTLSRDEVADHLRALPNPAEFVLEDVQEHISGELGLQDDSFLEILVLCLEELIEIQRRDDSQLQDKATQVATIWKGKITIEAPKSSLEALAFLLFIVAYGLKNLINEEEAALLASSIAHYEQAPRLFKSLSLNCEIRKFVKELIKKEQYIPAVRLVCLFKLNEEFSPSHLLEKEIINLRWSVLGKRPTESSQAKGKDAGRLRAILELVGDYKLEINIPGYLIAKLMIQRENIPPLVRCSVKHGTSSSNPQANSPNPASAHCSPNPAYAHRSPNPASAQSSSVNPQVPKPDVKPCLN